ncbi:MAG: acyltransferase [Ignavibacteriales bacterium]|nr:acyltransferase [Ignavibacteriales bacterium]
MNLSIIQTKPIFGEVKINIRDSLAMMESVEADLYVLPELFNTGYNFIDLSEVQSLAERSDGYTFQAIAEFAKKRKCYIVYGFTEKAESFFNSCALVGPEGLIGVYRKIHLFYREKLFFATGNLGFPVFDLPFGKIGLMICFDWIYPEAARTLALKGANLIAHPSNLVMPYCPDAMITRCLENKIFSATADRVGKENRGDQKLSFIGQSEVVSPKGEILLRLSHDKPEAGVVQVDLHLSENKKSTDYNDLFEDRKPEYYLQKGN